MFSFVFTREQRLREYWWSGSAAPKLVITRIACVLGVPHTRKNWTARDGRNTALNRRQNFQVQYIYQSGIGDDLLDIIEQSLCHLQLQLQRSFRTVPFSFRKSQINTVKTPWAFIGCKNVQKVVEEPQREELERPKRCAAHF